MKSIERRDYTRSCYCRRGYGGKIKVCGCGPITERRWFIVDDGITRHDGPFHGGYPTKREAQTAIDKETP